MDYAKLRYDDVRQKSSHNAFQRREGLYDHVLYWRIRSLEIDLLRRKPILGPSAPGDWFVCHGWLDPESTVERLSDVLSVCRGIRRTLPRHEVITLFIDIKEPFDTTASAAHSGRALDELLEAQIGRYLYRPADLLGRSPGAGSLQDAIAAAGWPTLRELRGKFIVVLTGRDDHLGTYVRSDAAADRATCFLSTRIDRVDQVPGARHVVFYNMEARHVRTAQAVRDAGLVSRSYYVDDRNRWNEAVARDCHHIATDKINADHDPWATTSSSRGFPFQALDGRTPPVAERGEVCGMWVESGDIWGQQDSFLYHYRHCPDGERDNTYEFAVSGPNSHVDDWVKGGIIARADLASRGAYFGVIRVGEKHGVRIQYRAGTNGTTEAIERQIGPDGRFDPDTLVHLRLRVTRNGRRARGWASVNGESWTLLGTYDFDEPLVHQGLGVSAHDQVGGAKFLFVVPRGRPRPDFDRTRVIGPRGSSGGRWVDWDGERRWRVRDFGAPLR